MHNLILLTNPNQPFTPFLLAHLPKHPLSTFPTRTRLFRRCRRNPNLNLGRLEVCRANRAEAFYRDLLMVSTAT